MGTMPIVKAVLLLGIALESNYPTVTSWPISDSPITPSRSAPKRDVTTPSSSNNWSTELNNFQGYSSSHTSPSSLRDSSQPVTTARTHKAHKPTQSATQLPYRSYEISPQTHRGASNRPGHVVQATSTLPTLQGGFQVSQDPRLQAPNAYPNPSTSYPPIKVQQDHNNGDSLIKPNSQHPEPNTSTPGAKQHGFTSSGSIPHFANGNNAPTIRSHRQSPTGFGSFDTQSKFHFSPSTAFNVQTPSLVNSPQRFPNPYHPVSSNRGFKATETVPGSFSTGLAAGPSFKAYEKFGDHRHHDGTPDFGHSGKQVSSPFPFYNGPQVSGFVKAIEHEPVLLSSGIGYQAQPSSMLNLEFPRTNPSSLASGPTFFSSAVGNYQPRVVPVHSASSTSQIPRYKGASVNAFADNGYPKPAGGYQLLTHQPQLHFTGTGPLPSVGGRQPNFFQSKRPYEQIRADVEVIDKKRPQLPESDSSEEHDFDGGYKRGREFAPVDVEASIPVKIPERQVNFELPRSNLFDSYDEAFGKYSKLASRDSKLGSRDKQTVKTNAKPVYQNVDDEEEKNDNSGEYRSSYSEDGSPGASSYEDEDEEESRRSERLEVRDERGRKKDDGDDDDDDGDDDEGSDAYRSYGVDFEKDFEESYRKELPKNDYIHVKEVPEIDDASAESKKIVKNRESPRSTRLGVKQKSRHVIHEDSNEPKSYESYVSHNYENPKTTDYRDSDGDGSAMTYAKTTKSSKPIGQASWGEKISRDRGTTRYGKSDDEDTTLKNEETGRIDSKKVLKNGESNRWLGSSRQSSNDLRFTSTTLSPIEVVGAFGSSSLGGGDGLTLGTGITRTIDVYGAPSTVLHGFANPEERGYRSPVDGGSRRYFWNGPAA